MPRSRKYFISANIHQDLFVLKRSVVKQLSENEHKKTRMEMTLTNNLLAINVLQVLMIFYQVCVTFKKRGYFEIETVQQMFGEKDSGQPIFFAAEPTAEPEHCVFLKYSLVIGLSLLVVSMVSIPIVIRRMKSKSSTSSSSGDKSLLDLSYEEHWDYIDQYGRVRQVLIGFVAKTRAGQDVRKYSASQITYQTVPVQRLSVLLPVSEQGSLPLADPDLHMCHEEMRMPADLVQHVVSPPPAQDRPLLGQEDQEDPDATRPLPGDGLRGGCQVLPADQLRGHPGHGEPHPALLLLGV